MRIYKSVEEIIGHTPLLQIDRYAASRNLPVTIWAKLEKCNPAGSAKDRAAAHMIEVAERDGLLKPGSVIIEPTSGNTGIGLAQSAALKGYRLILTMPESMSEERRNLLAAYGAELVLTPAAEGMAGSVAKAEELHALYADSFIPDQFGNPANPESHYLTTGPEIWEDTDGTVDIFVAGIGTGGTISGVAKFLKEQNPAVQIVAAEPADSPVLTKGEAFAKSHALQGMGANFVPKALDTSLLDEILTITTKQAYECGKQMAFTEGVLVGVSSGAALAAVEILARRPENVGKKIVVLLPDTGEHYLSVDGFLK